MTNTVLHTYGLTDTVDGIAVYSTDAVRTYGEFQIQDMHGDIVRVTVTGENLSTPTTSEWDWTLRFVVRVDGVLAEYVADRGFTREPAVYRKVADAMTVALNMAGYNGTVD